MANWERYKQLVEVNGETQRDRNIARYQRKIAALSGDMTACKQVTINDEAFSIVIHSTDNRNQKTFNVLSDRHVAMGGIVSWTDRKGNLSHWIITEVDFDDDVFITGRMERCNRQLTWQNPSTLAIVSRWCTAEKPYYSNLEAGKVLTLSKREYKIQLPYDEETSLLELDKRFLLEKVNGEPKAYKITSIDTITERYDENYDSVGFLVVNVSQDDYNPNTDNAAMMIANYRSTSPSVANPPEPHCAIAYEGEPVLIIGGSYKTFRAVFADGEGTALEGYKPVWQIDMSDERMRDYLDVKISDDSYSLQMRPNKNYGLNFAVVRLTLRDELNQLSSSIDVHIEAGW